MRNIKLTVAYDGTDFHGWQIQSAKPTVQGTLTEVARKLTQERVTVYGAGRTDAGVHALGQVAHFKTQSALSPAEFQRAFNALLPPEIRVAHCEEVGPDFHARWQAQAKTYCYRIWRGRVVPPFVHRYVLHYPWPLDEAAMAAAARRFEGTHDFSSFAASSGSEEDDRDRAMAREIFQSLVIPPQPGDPAAADLGFRAAEGTPQPGATGAREGAAAEASRVATATLPVQGAAPEALRWAAFHPRDELLYLVRGRSFLRYMVRKLAGTLLEVGKGRLAPDDIPRLFELRDRSKSGPTVPPHGLFLVSVEYPEPWKL